MLATAIIVAVLGTMAAIVALQLLRRPRAVNDRRIGLISTARTTRRTVQVLRIAAKHGLRTRGEDGGPASVSSGRQLRSALEEAGVVFVKLGQALADRPDLIPPPIADELALLQSDVTPLERPVMEPELRRHIPDPERVFADFDWSPLGSASIGQAYRATLRGGQEVIVKVRRPGVVLDVARDSVAALNIAELLERNIEWARQVGLADVVRGLLAELEKELDYEREAEAMADMAANRQAADVVHLPQPVLELSGPAVLVMEYVSGIPLVQSPTDAAPRRQSAIALASAVLGPMLRGQRFHADPHPGNVIVRDEGELALVDFGSTAVLPPHEQSSLRWLMLGIQLREPALMRDALLGVAQPTQPIDHASLDRALAQLLADYLPPGGRLDPAAVPALLNLSADAGLRMPASSGVLFRTLLTLLASLQRLDPGFDVLEFTDEITGGHQGLPGSTAEVTDFLRSEVVTAAPLLRRVPRLLDSVATKVDRGDLSVHVRMLSHPDDIAVVNGLVNRALLVILAGVLGVVSAMLFGLAKGPYIGPDFSVYDLLGSIGLVTGAILVMRVLLEVLASSRRI